jgi:hypothetical protein
VSFKKETPRFAAGRPRFSLPRRPPLALIRIVALAVLGAFASAWAIWHYYTTPLPPLRVAVPPAPAPTPTYDADAGERPVPDLFEEEADGG